MKYTVTFVSRAESDADQIIEWIARQSPQGAGHWYQALKEAAATLSDAPARHPIAPEFVGEPEPIRQLSFKTRRGRRYRLLFVIVASEVRIVSVRAPGQPPVTKDDLA